MVAFRDDEPDQARNHVRVQPMSESVLDFGAAFSRRAELWSRVVAVAPARDDCHFRAAQIAFAVVLPVHGSRLVTGTTGACRITDSARLSEVTGLCPTIWSTAPDSFRQGDALVVPWPVTLEIVSAVGTRHGDRLRTLIGRETKREHVCCLHGNAAVKAGAPTVRSCCKCEFGIRKGPALPHDDGFYCEDCDDLHPGSRMLDGCPNWWEELQEDTEPAGASRGDSA